MANHELTIHTGIRTSWTYLASGGSRDGHGFTREVTRSDSGVLAVTTQWTSPSGEVLENGSELYVVDTWGVSLRRSIGGPPPVDSSATLEMTLTYEEPQRVVPRVLASGAWDQTCIVNAARQDIIQNESGPPHFGDMTTTRSQKTLKATITGDTKWEGIPVYKIRKEVTTSFPDHPNIKPTTRIVTELWEPTQGLVQQTTQIGKTTWSLELEHFYVGINH